ncbi:MAG TPA: Uma2 family endonuclease [Polyangiaceae bacterium]|nr:Uma2 family endonuclease [Polyangiaceae bacterium]
MPQNPAISGHEAKGEIAWYGRDMAAPARPATYQDVLDAPEHRVAEVIDGELYLQPRPRKPHAAAASALGDELGPPFRRGKGGPGGWIILDEPEIHVGKDIIVPDLAGWRRERMPKLVDDEAFFSLPPDWVCEVLSRRTAALDRTKKLPIYARERVSHAWLVDPVARTLEGYALEDGGWKLRGTWAGDDPIRVEPFDAIELELSALWADVELLEK